MPFNEVKQIVLVKEKKEEAPNRRLTKFNLCSALATQGPGPHFWFTGYHHYHDPPFLKSNSNLILKVKHLSCCWFGFACFLLLLFCCFFFIFLLFPGMYGDRNTWVQIPTQRFNWLMCIPKPRAEFAANTNLFDLNFPTINLLPKNSFH